ncbi:sodium ion-translocating decarboxylase subunit beta [Treponema phagedenis]|uniref:Oxaloacetate decarboxylase beta chain 1 n=1 Tax=Treponema phagedenis TaxID=162 RepID=A0A0B7GYH1_TREPH|nr:sodium ion-translocating decarboxylase subunit beta [Treponema phagedenis]QEJ94812.1 sodium ion-translocating decarboxylase subunit beta [Treponema phagedenis]QEJ97998.1 sodium ion-translocating decarboxylase subunit beta [Treponema phagedenis]QEK00717.1 sodium ion-translocating decarboxylase subunit beta [Treponema phagedenis]QEK03505.1 sodium ion-translocating decarboxylase subunit beta [Treponema phagedenis]QEK05725.1 sodium ion-translocating decarboxylase subunit beta [Treponema phagede
MLEKQAVVKKQKKFITIVILFAVAFSALFSISGKVFADSGNDESVVANENIIAGSENVPKIAIGKFLENTWKNTGIQSFITGQEEMPDIADPQKMNTIFGYQQLIMLLVGLLIIYLGAAKDFEPLLLIPIGFGTVLVNIPGAGMYSEHGMLKLIYDAGVGNEFFPMLIFMGIGALTDFGPLIANPKTAILGGAAQLGVFITLFGVSVMNYIPGIDYTMLDACAIAIIGGADGPTSIYVAGKLAKDLMAVIAVAAYSYMALVPIIQPPIMRLLTTQHERKIKMKQLRKVSKTEKILFPITMLLLSILLIPPAAPLIGMIAFGNFVRECGVVERLSKTMANELLNIVSILLSLGVGSQMTPDKIMNPNALGIIVLGLFAFAVATAGGVLMAKLMNLFLKEKINPLIGSAGVSAVPMAARVSNKVGLEEDPTNFLLMHAMGPNVAGVIGTAITAGVFISAYGG